MCVLVVVLCLGTLARTGDVNESCRDKLTKLDPHMASYVGKT